MKALAWWLAAAWGMAGAAEPPANLARGQDLYGRCMACHAIEENRTGPAHCGLFGRKAGSVTGYANYSEALRRSRIVWSEATLDRFLRSPLDAVPGTTMTYMGIADAGERRDLIAWLKQATRPGAACALR